LNLKKKNSYQDPPWNKTIEEDTFRCPDLFAGGKGINVWSITISQIFIKIAVLGYNHFMLENRNMSINMGTEALVAG
jgi:hypothetical protein